MASVAASTTVATTMSPPACPTPTTRTTTATPPTSSPRTSTASPARPPLRDLCDVLAQRCAHVQSEQYTPYAAPAVCPPSRPARALLAFLGLAPRLIPVGHRVATT